MKSFIIALFLGAFLLVSSKIYIAKLESASQKLLDINASISQSIENEDFSAAADSTKKLSDELSDFETFFAALGNHQEIDNIETSLAELESFIDGEQKYDALSKTNVLTFLFEHLPKNSKLKIENIF